MGNTDKFEMIVQMYDTPERIHIAKVSSDAIREYLVDAKSKSAIDFGCGTGLVGLNLLDDFHSMLFLDTSPNMIDQIKHKISDSHIQNADTLCFDFVQEGPVIFMPTIFSWLRCYFTFKMLNSFYQGYSTF